MLDDRPEVAKLIGVPLMEAGHEVLSQLSPVDFEKVLAFRPQVIVAGIYRKRQTGGLAGESELVGLESLRQLAAYPASLTVPLLLVGIGLDEGDIPIATRYDLFLQFPEEMAAYVPKVEELSTKRKSSSHISVYICPTPGCGHRLTYVRAEKDLFCMKCGAGVTMLDDEHCTWMAPDGEIYPCKVLHVTQLGAKQLG